MLYIAHDLGALDENQQQRETRQLRGFLRELEAMIRLRSPNTVNVFGALTSLSDRMVLVMELLPNGDLLTLLKKSREPLPEEQSRCIIRDICTGMAFLHSKKTVHGDLKSANVLLDGGGRAKVKISVLDRWSSYGLTRVRVFDVRQQPYFWFGGDFRYLYFPARTLVPCSRAQGVLFVIGPEIHPNTT